MYAIEGICFRIVEREIKSNFFHMVHEGFDYILYHQGGTLDDTTIIMDGI